MPPIVFAQGCDKPISSCEAISAARVRQVTTNWPHTSLFAMTVQHLQM
jgi:hypothetical protein